MDPTLDTTCLRELVDQRSARLHRAANAHAAHADADAAGLAPVAPGRARRRVADALRYLADRLEPHRVDAPTVAS